MNRLCRSASPASDSSSARVNTFPAGFEGVLIIIARVRGVIAAATASRSSCHSPLGDETRIATGTGTARIPASMPA